MKIIEPELIYMEDEDIKKVTFDQKTAYSGMFGAGKAVCVDNGVIAAVGDREEIEKAYPGVQIVRWENQVLVPGTVNSHNHCFQSLLRGLSCDRPFLEWRDEALYKFSPRMTREDIYNGALFAFAEMMKCGVTTVCDFFYLHNFGTESDEMVIQAAKDLGIRLVLARTMYDWKGAPSGYVETITEAQERTRYLNKKYKDNPMVSVVPAPHSLHAASIEMIECGHELARDLECKFHIHVAEEPFEVEQVKKEHGGLTPIEVLDQYGVVDERMVIIHGVWLKKSEIDVLGAKGGNLVYCPSSNMFLADGITDIPAMRRAGVTIGLGSDGACSNNRISVFEEMRMAALLQKAKTCDAMCLNYMEAFRMGTINGAEILDLKSGKIQEGYEADFVGIDMGDFSMQPISGDLEQVLPNIVYSMQPTAIREVMVHGNLTVHEGRLVLAEERQITAKVAETMKRLQG